MTFPGVRISPRAVSAPCNKYFEFRTSLFSMMYTDYRRLYKIELH